MFMICSGEGWYMEDATKIDGSAADRVAAVEADANASVKVEKISTLKVGKSSSKGGKI